MYKLLILKDIYLGSMMIKLPYLSSLLILGMVLMVLQQSQHPRQENQLMSDSGMLTEVYSGQLDFGKYRPVHYSG